MTHEPNQHPQPHEQQNSHAPEQPSQHGNDPRAPHGHDPRAPHDNFSRAPHDNFSRAPHDKDPGGPRGEEARLAAYGKHLVVVVCALIAAWGFAMMPLPLSLIAGIAALVAIVALVLMLRAAWPTDRRKSALVTTILGVPACLALIASTIVSLAFYGPIKDFQDCHATALTDKAKTRCEHDLPGSISSWLSL